MTYDSLCIEYENEVQITERNVERECEEFDVYGMKGLYVDGNIALERSMTFRHKKCKLAEEIGHHYTTSGNILDMRIPNNRKQERRAREWGANKLVNYNRFIRACNMYDNIYQIAEELDVTYDTVEAYYNYLYRTNAINNHT